MKVKNFGGSEILHVAEAVAKDKGIAKNHILEALEEAISVAAKRKYGANVPVKTHINRQSGDIELYRETLVLEDVSKFDTDQENVRVISLEEARAINPDLQDGDTIKEILPPLEIGRLNAGSVKQVIISKVKELERDKLYEEFKDRIGEILNGVVERIEGNGFIIKISGAEAVLRKDQALKTDYYKLGDRIRACLVKLDKESKGPILILSRTHKEFVSQLFKQEAPEIYDKIIEIKDIARDPGSRTKISVYSSDPSVDPVGSCVGVRGARVQTVIKELKGEKIDIVKWSEDPATYVVNALGSMQVSKVVIDEEQNRIEVVIPNDDQSQVIGRRGQNVKLISELVGWKISITTEETEIRKRQEEFSRITELFMERLNLEEILAQLLASEGYNSIQSLAEASVVAIASIEGLDEEIATELISRAKESMAEEKVE
ncbi:transcription termination factor NusA [Candidatus Bandiella euplotis]|uniref:Transcription termination/antitermination protein NusA n=1 Tax=Candidatus Bandiella euplotis TaxID=1664265 RepID=A0ABZ0UMF6_9RICK|nr:transcription termination factor NusA [Candidatus Bandiella woodruffii]WPX97326.1 Transcription termination/antitermination protein NusA [Candidatus Bandiella woodruffii]